MFQVYSRVIQILLHYRLLQDIDYIVLPICSSVYLLIPDSKLIPLPTFPFGNHKFVFCVFESVSVLKISLYNFFKIPHVSDII